jgi:hypothetical protein
VRMPKAAEAKSRKIAVGTPAKPEHVGSIG